MESENQEVKSKIVSHVIHPLAESAFWMKFLGVLSIIYGVACAITIVGIIFAWIPIWLGVLLFGAASHSQEAVRMESESHARQALLKLKTMFILNGVMALLGLVIVGVSLLLGLAGIIPLKINP